MVLRLLRGQEDSQTKGEKFIGLGSKELTGNICQSCFKRMMEVKARGRIYKREKGSSV